MGFAPGMVAVASAADFDPGPGTYTADTSALTLTGPGTSVAGTDQGGVAVFSFGNVDIPSGATINVTGSRPFKLVASGSLTLAGTINGRGKNATDLTPGPNAGGPGGGAGGADGTQPGAGPGGGGVASDTLNGGGGGGFGGPGAPGAVKSGDTGTAGAGGSAYGDLNELLQGGSGGAGGSSGAGNSVTGGGGGGGAIALIAGTLTVTSSGQVLADGGNGALGAQGASGGGSGGGILVRGQTVNVAGLLSATGGQGGLGDCCGDGGGGGGGRVAYEYTTLIATGTADVVGGTSGTVSTSGYTGHGGTSPDATGAPGVVTQVAGPGAGTGAASAVTPEAATLNGTVTPNGTVTTYHFDYGTTTAYGSQTPPSDQVAGSGSGAAPVSQTLTGLSPHTTYHYRVVATDSYGFTVDGSDATFTTPALPVPGASVRTIVVGPTAVLTVTCSSPYKQTCAGHFAITVHERIKHGKVTAVTAAASKKNKSVKTVTLGKGSYRVAAGGIETIAITLNKAGKQLLAKLHKLPTTLSFTASSGAKPSKRTLKFTYPIIK